MIVTLFVLLILLRGAYLAGKTYCAIKLYKLKNRMALFVSATFFADAIGALTLLATVGFGPRPSRIVWWVVIAGFISQLIVTLGIGATMLYFFGWINGVVAHAKPEAKNDPE